MERLWSWALGLAVAVTPVALGAGEDRCLPPYPPSPPSPPICIPPEPIVYENGYERVWVLEEVRMVRERVWVEAKYERRPVVYYDEEGRKVIRYEYVLVSPGHWETQYRRVVIPGHWEWVVKGKEVGPGVTGVPSVGVEGYARDTGKKEEGVFSPLTEWPK